MRIKQAAKASGLSAHTIRYYEKSGMLPGITRGPEGHRQFRPRDVDWLVLLASLRETGMPMQAMAHFAGLYRQGDATVAERKSILAGHQVYLEAQQQRLTTCRAILARKIGRYNDILGDAS